MELGALRLFIGGWPFRSERAAGAGEHPEAADDAYQQDGVNRGSQKVGHIVAIDAGALPLDNGRFLFAVFIGLGPQQMADCDECNAAYILVADARPANAGDGHSQCHAG